jgi:lysophospholipase L1-like esterase
MDFTADEYVRRDTARLTEILAGPPVTWVFAGDSITQGCTHTRGRRNYVEHFAERVRGELGRTRDAVINSGVVAATASSLLPEFDWRVGRFAPDVVFAMFGTNDCLSGPEWAPEFRYHLTQVVERARDLGATTVLQVPPPVLPGGERDPEVLSAYADQVRAVADELGVLLVDHALAWSTAAGSSPAPVGWLDDEAHPGPVGHQRMALTILEALGVADADSDVCALEPDQL